MHNDLNTQSVLSMKSSGYYSLKTIGAKIAIDNDIVKQKKMLDDCLIKLKLEDLKERKRRINMRLNYQSELNVDEEKRLLNELQKIIESEKKLKY